MTPRRRARATRVLRIVDRLAIAKAQSLSLSWSLQRVCHHGSPRRNQTPHGGREIRDPFADFESLVDEGGDKRARELDPEHDRQASDLVFQGHPLAD
jgi:hypothetical protein